MGSGATLDRKIYSFFKKGVFDGDLEILGNYIITKTLESAAEEYALKVSATVEDSVAGICKFGVLGKMLLTTGALVAEVWGGYSKTQLSAGQATGQVGAHYFEFIVDTAVANCPSASVIQLASWINGNLNSEHGVICVRDYGSKPMTNLFNIMDHTSGTGKLWYGSTLKIRIGSAAKYIPLSTTEGQLTIAGMVAPSTNNGAALGSTDLKWSDLFLADGAVIDFNSADVTITHLTDILRIAGGRLNIGDTQGAGIILDGTGAWTKQQALIVHASITAATVAANPYAGLYSTMSVAANQSLDVSAFAVWGELWLNNVTLTSSSNYAAVWGNVLVSATTVTGTGVLASLWGCMNLPAAFTNAGKLAGCMVDSEMTSGLTNSGTIAAFYATKGDGKLAWPMGMYLPSGACKAGLVMGAKSSNSAIGHHIGVANSADNAGDKAIAVFCDDNNAVLATDAQGINSRCLILAAQTGAFAMDALRGHLRIVASVTPSAQKGFAATSGYVEASGTYTFGDATNIVFISALSGTVELGGTPTISDNVRLCGLLLTGGFGSAYNGDTKPAVGIMMEAGGSYGFQFALGFHDGVSGMISASSHTTNETHKIAVWINGVGTRYIHVCSD